jgi:hypothetical protein
VSWLCAGLDVILEELHWLVLITGHVLANEPKDEHAHIPSAINALSDVRHRTHPHKGARTHQLA